MRSSVPPPAVPPIGVRPPDQLAVGDGDHAQRPRQPRVEERAARVARRPGSATRRTVPVRSRLTSPPGAGSSCSSGAASPATVPVTAPVAVSSVTAAGDPGPWRHATSRPVHEDETGGAGEGVRRPAPSGRRGSGAPPAGRRNSQIHAGLASGEQRRPSAAMPVMSASSSRATTTSRRKP